MNSHASPGSAGILPAGFHLAGWKPALPGTDYGTDAGKVPSEADQSRCRIIHKHPLRQWKFGSRFAGVALATPRGGKAVTSSPHAEGRDSETELSLCTESSVVAGRLKDPGRLFGARAEKSPLDAIGRIG